MRAFIQRHLDPATRLGEVLFGLIMALGITGAVRLGIEEADNRELLIAVLGCNLAWGVVDGVMFAMLALFERGRKARIVNGVLSAPTEEVALERIGEEFGDRLEPLTTPDERQQIYRWMLDVARRTDREPPRSPARRHPGRDRRGLHHYAGDTANPRAISACLGSNCSQCDYPI